MKVYVVTQPESIRGIYATWAECKGAVSGVAGARYQAVSSRELGEAMLRGEAVRTQPAEGTARPAIEEATWTGARSG